jgi:APA family basic amino acid/polyamine antiporter
MADQETPKRLKKELSLFSVYALATGTTLSGGLFLLPGLAARESGPAMVLCYLLAVVPLIPAMMCIVELATAMPRAGGPYYFLDRAIGPLAGTVGGIGTWLALVLKSAFALVGMGVYASLFLNGAPVYVHTAIACGLAILFGVLNWLGAKKTSALQVVLVVGLLAILVWFIFTGAPKVHFDHFKGFFNKGGAAIVSTAGLVFMSYVGLTKVASVAEEVRNPERNLPLGMFTALGSAVAIYALCTFILVGVIPMDVLTGADGKNTYLTPMAEASRRAVEGNWGLVLISIAALLAFTSVANAGVLSSSRYPLAMARDHLLPARFERLGRWGTPTFSIVVSVGAIVFFLLVLDPMRIAKLASAFQLLMFALLCGAVIVMRESKIESYDPGYKTPWYPWTQIVGIVAPILLISQMGALPVVFSLGLVVLGICWYLYYARTKVVRHGAIYHVFERLGRRRFDDLDRELRGILKEKGLRDEDPFVEIVARAGVLDVAEPVIFEEIVGRASSLIARHVSMPVETLAMGFLEGTRTGATPVSGGAALPHMRVEGLDFPLMVMVRSRSGIEVALADPLSKREISRTTHAVFFLVSPDDDPGQHLRLLAEVASRVDQAGFIDEWLEAEDIYALKEIMLLHERYITLTLQRGYKSGPLIDQMLRELRLPEGCLVAVIRRAGASIVPGGDTVLEEGDQLTVIGSEGAVAEFARQYGPMVMDKDADEAPDGAL